MKSNTEAAQVWKAEIAKAQQHAARRKSRDGTESFALKDEKIWLDKGKKNTDKWR